MLQEYAKNPTVNWKHKDAAIYLVTSLASKAQTQKVRICRTVVMAAIPSLAGLGITGYRQNVDGRLTKPIRLNAA